MSTSRIAAGLAQKRPGSTPDLTRCYRDLDSILSAADLATSVSRQHEKTVQRLENDFQNEKRKIEEGAQVMRMRPDDARQYIKSALLEHRRTLRENSAEERRKPLDELSLVSENARLTVEHLYPTPVAYLSTFGVGSEALARHLTMLQNAGPAAIKSYAAYAEAHGDPILAHAVVLTVDRMPSDKRPVSAQQLAEAVVGPKHAELMAAAKRIELAHKTATDADRAFERDADDTHGKISRALDSRDIERLEAALDEPEG